MVFLVISEYILWIISGIGILQGILLALLLYFHPKSDRSVNKFLALYIFALTIVMATPFILKVLTWQRSYIQQPMALLIGPLLYLYIRSFKEVITWRKALPHFLFFFLFFIPTYWNVTTLAAKYPNAESVPPEILKYPSTIAINYIKFGQSVFYYFLARKTLISYQKSIRHLFSETSTIDLKWARLLINGYMLMVASAVVIFSFMLRYPERFDVLLLLIMAFSTPYIYLATYKGIMQPTIWQVQPNVSHEMVEDEIIEAEKIETEISSHELPKPSKTGLNDDKIEEILNKILFQMNQEKIYQESELTLQQLAGKLQLPTYLVSQAINEGAKRNFYELVNSYRVEEAKRLLIDPKNRNFTILSVAFEAGFNSKTTFNTVFKKFTGLTPTDFRDKQRTPVFSAS